MSVIIYIIVTRDVFIVGSRNVFQREEKETRNCKLGSATYPGYKLACFRDRQKMFFFHLNKYEFLRHHLLVLSDQVPLPRIQYSKLQNNPNSHRNHYRCNKSSLLMEDLGQGGDSDIQSSGEKI